jgi:hypothetical protein
VKSDEHRTIGDDATGAASVTLLPEHSDRPLELRFGDIVALAGDFLLPVVDARPDVPVLAGTSEDIIGGLRVISADEGRTDDRLTPGGTLGGRVAGPVGDVERRVRDRFIALAAQNADHFVKPWGDEVALTTERAAAGQFASAPVAYRRLHEAAMVVAYRSGLDGGGVELAIAREAAAQHYLTDAFASGHVRTPVAAIRRFWRRRYPEFWKRLQAKVASDTSTALRRRAPALRVLPRHRLEGLTLKAVHNRTRALPPIFLGDLLARVFHDWDNEHGLLLEDGGMLFGDGHVGEGAGRDLALRAARAGVDDVELAHRLGTTGKELVGGQLHAEVLAITRGGGSTFAAEALLPRLSPDNPPLNWKASDVEELWDTPVAGSRGPTVGDAAVRALEAGGEVYRRLAGLGAGVADAIDVPAAAVLRRYLGPRAARAYQEGFVEQLSGDPRAAVRDVVGSSDDDPVEWRCCPTRAGVRAS